MIRHTMSKAKLTVSLPQEVAEYLRSTPNASAVVAEAVVEYRARETEKELEAAYLQDAAESERLNRDWESVDAEVNE